MILLWLSPFDKLMNNRHQQQSQQGTAIVQQQNAPPPVRDKPFDDNNPPPDNGSEQPPAPRNDEFGEHRFNPPEHEQPNNGNRVDIVSIFMFMVVLAISISTDVSKRLREAAEQAAKAEADKANAELSVLKAQVNPHFLFNTLNNIYSLAVTNDENTAESILKLSNIMRYVTDDAPEDFVTLQKEWDCISDFIDLQRLRIGNKVTLNVSVQGDLSGKMIAPFILLTFIENIFKYGISNHQASSIIIRLSVVDSGIEFFCSNPISEMKETGRKSTGIANIKKRLAYLYQNNYSLNISTSNNLYSVQLLLKNNNPVYAANLHSYR